MDKGDLFTDNQTTVALNEAPAAIAAALAELQRCYPDAGARLCKWNDAYLAVPLRLSVELPSRGPVGGLDLRDYESVYLLFHKTRYPYCAPRAHSNRRDFPAHLLPHVNPTSMPGQHGASLCLHRGNLDDWFAEHSVTDFVERVRAWLRDAARCRLIRKEDGFETVRVDAPTIGYAIFAQSTIEDPIRRHWHDSGGERGSAVVWYSLLGSPKTDPLIRADGYAIRADFLLPAPAWDAARQLSIRMNDLHTSDRPVDRLLFGLVVFGSESRTTSTYVAKLPGTWDELRRWGAEYGADLQTAADVFCAASLQLLGGVPVTVAIRRPQHLIGQTTDIELVSFVVNASGEHLDTAGGWLPTAPVHPMAHRTPLTPSFARQLSGSLPGGPAGRILLLGAGALGSKIGLHLARAGRTAMTIVDPDELSPHNLVRHALGPDDLGKHKVDGLKRVIEAMYKGEETGVDAKAVDVQDLLRETETLDPFAIIVDATASQMVRNVLVDSPIDRARVARCEIADGGAIGLLSVEGTTRNPRLDDLQVLAFDTALDCPPVSDWLRRAKDDRSQLGSRFEQIVIGLGCNSDTMRMADDVVSLHAATFTRALSGALLDAPKAEGGGFVQITVARDGVVQSLRVGAGAWDIRRAVNDATWEVRFRDGVCRGLQDDLRAHRPNETGGMFVGRISRRRRTIYITRIILAPEGSAGTPVGFVRGAVGAPELLRRVSEATGDTLEYVGEWHTHPNGGSRPSDTDLNAVKNLRDDLRKIGMPVLMVIATPRGIHPYVYDTVES